MRRLLCALLTLPMLLGCGKREETVLQEAVVIVLCKVIEDDDTVSYEVVEVWRDLSKAKLKYGVGITLPQVEKKEDGVVYGTGAIVFYSESQATTKGKFESLYVVHGQQVPGWQHKTVNEIRQLVRSVPYAGKTSTK